jgi:hypothetical protein
LRKKLKVRTDDSSVNFYPENIKVFHGKTAIFDDFERNGGVLCFQTESSIPRSGRAKS